MKHGKNNKDDGTGYEERKRIHAKTSSDRISFVRNWKYALPECVYIAVWHG